MAIYSCNLRSIGRTTHAEGTAGAHLRYIGRERAASEILSAHIPNSPAMARTWMNGRERQARKNARLCDKIRIALPRELDAPQRAALVRAFMADLTAGGRVPWFAAIHQTGRDAHNPHAHIVVVDSDIETGKRLLCLSDSTRDREKKYAGSPDRQPSNGSASAGSITRTRRLPTPGMTRASTGARSLPRASTASRKSISVPAPSTSIAAFTARLRRKSPAPRPANRSA